MHKIQEETRTTYFTIVGSIFVATLLISNISAQKLFAFGPFVFSGGILIFPVTYIFGDVLTEVYGYARSRQIIWTGLFCNLLMAGFLWLVIQLPPAKGWPLQEQFSTVLGLVPRVVLASTVAYWMGEFSNSFAMAKLKVSTSGRYLWIRTVSSTIVGQSIDTAIFVIIAFSGLFEREVLISAIWSGALFKILYEVVATPLTYAIVNFLKRKEGLDPFDDDTDFNPFKLSTD